MDEFHEWFAKYEAVAANPEQQALNKKHKPNKISDTIDEMETQWLLQGATACEDKLQVYVPRTLRNLAKAGINIWMITGDRVGTAMNIAQSCELLLPQPRHRWITLTEPHIVTYFEDEIRAGRPAPGTRLNELTLTKLEQAQRA